MEYPGLEGFLGNRASLMLDIVFLAMFIVVPVMGWSIFLAKYRQRYRLHMWIQIVLGIVLLVAVTLFEVDMRVHGWSERAEASPYYDSNSSQGLVNWSLWLHLVFAVSTTIVWIFVIVQAVRKFSTSPTSCSYGPTHRFWGKLAAIDMTLTAVTGWVFYYLAFVA